MRRSTSSTHSRNASPAAIDALESRLLFSTWVVTNNSDSAAVAHSLRWAINQSNAAAVPSVIDFHLPTSQLEIHVGSPLPNLLKAVKIDASSQPGYAGHPLVQIDGGGFVSDGLDVVAGSSSIRGLSITRFDEAGIYVNGPNAAIDGNYIGLTPAGKAAGNGIGVIVAFQDGTVIGNINAADRNVISANVKQNILVTGGNFTRIQNNYIGTSTDGKSKPAGANGAVAGVEIDAGSFIPGQTSHGNLVGGTASWQRNVISGNQGDGVFLSSASSAIVVLGNLIGTDASGAKPLGNGGDGVRTDGQFNRIGNLAKGGANVIAYNGTNLALAHPAGVAVDGAGAAANQITGNSIFSNRGLGIDLGSDGEDAINPALTVTGPNGRPNHPTLFSAVHTSTGVTVKGTLDEYHFPFRIDFYASSVADPSGFGEGQRYLGSVTVIGASMPTPFTANLGAVPSGWVITATSTDEGPGNTSEFSNAVGVK